LGRSVFKQRNRWIITTVMAIASLAFLSLLFMPFLTAFQTSNQPAAADASPGAALATQQQELEVQAKGYELVLQREPENQTALRGLLETRIRQDNVKGAIEPLEKLAKLNPDQADYTVLLAQAKQRVGDAEGAAQSYRDVLKTQPGNVNALQGFVDLMLEQKRPEAAIGLLQDTLRGAEAANEATPGSIDVTSVQLLLGRVYAEQGRSDEAIAIYDQAIETDNQDFRPVLVKAIVLRTAGRATEAEPLFTTAAALAPAQYKDQINQLAAGETPSPADAANPNSLPSPAASASPIPAPSSTSPAPSISPQAENSPSSSSRVTGAAPAAP